MDYDAGAGVPNPAGQSLAMSSLPRAVDKASLKSPPKGSVDTAYGSQWGRHLGGHGGRASVATVMFEGELDGEERLDLFLRLVAGCQRTYGSQQAESKLAERVQMAWRDRHFTLIPSNNFGLGGNLSIPRIKQHLKRLGQRSCKTV
jgi:hypothetical protein